MMNTAIYEWWEQFNDINEDIINVWPFCDLRDANQNEGKKTNDRQISDFQIDVDGVQAKKLDPMIMHTNQF